MDATVLVRQLIQASDRLVEIMERENEALQKRHYNLFVELQERKNGLTASYEHLIEMFKHEFGKADDLTPSLRDEMKQASERFEITAMENLKLIKSARDAGTKILDAIRQAVSMKKSETNVYNASGMSHTRGYGRQSNATSISFNESL